MYIVERYGIYQQGMFGIFESFEDARSHAIEAIKQEADCYHDFLVTEIELNKKYSESNRISDYSGTHIRFSKKLDGSVTEEIEQE